MKKFMKAIAFVTVMCMALSTVAFATNEGTVAQDTTNYKQVNVTVTGAAAGEQVALLIVGKDKPISTEIPLYIDQKPAVAQGEGAAASFKAPLTVDDGTEVDVYVGYSSYSGAAIKLGTVEITAPVTEVAITKTESGAVVGSDGKLGVYATVNFTAIPDGYSLDAMIWALELKEGGYKYTKAIEGLKNYGYGVLSGDTKFSAIMDIPENLEFSGKADAIFLFVKSETEKKEAYSDNSEIHSGKKVTNNSGGN